MQNNMNEQYLKDFHTEQFQHDLISWFQREQRILPWRQVNDPYKIWVSEIMLQQTKVEAVIPYYHRFIEKFPTVYELAAANEQEVLKVWEGLGYYSRARNLQAAVREVAETYDGKVPANKEELSKLKGVGPYTTGAILSIAFGIPEPAVDGNVMRVFSRIFSVWEDISKNSTRKLFEQLVREVIDKQNPSDFNQAVMELGAIVCTPKSPSCLLCPVQRHCRAFEEGNERELPIKAKKKAPRELYLTAIVIENDKDEIFIQKRGPKGLLANLWEFPNHEYTVGLDSKTDQATRFIKETYRMNVKEVKENN